MVSRQLWVLLALMGAAFAAGGCSIQAMTGDTMSAFTVEQVVPQTMASDDVAMACAGGLGQAQLMEAFGRVTDPEPRASIVTFSSAGMCAELEGWEAELRRLRALKEGRVAEAQDALTQEKLAHYDAAKRNLFAFNSLVRAYGEVGEGCPKLDAKENDELFYMLGLSSGMLAVVHDRGAGGEAGVPMSVPQGVLRATECLDAERWWGMPLALRAAIWTSIPGVLPAGQDPWVEMARAADYADKGGVSLAYALWIQTAASNGMTPQMCQAVDRYTQSLVANPNRNPSYRLLDAYAAMIIRHEVNKQWIQSVGYRAPAGALACYSADSVEPGDEPDLDLLDGLND
jgi:hypothetical protein